MVVESVILFGCGFAAVMPLGLAWRFRTYCRCYPASALLDCGPERENPPKVSVILPCKGVDPGFEENLATIFEQDFPDVELIFATATEDDEARPVIRKVMSRYSDVKAKLVTAGLPTRCSQQNNNQLAAARAARLETEIFVVMDSDIRVRPDYLTSLVAPFTDSRVMATTGYRWYSPVRGGFGSWLRSVWNAGAYVFMPDEKRNFAWGGSMAFRRRDFDYDKLHDLWASTLSDDHPLSRHVHEQGGKIVFVPRCIAVSYEDSSLRDTIAWTTRQTLVTRIYNTPFWKGVLVVHGLQTLATVSGLALLVSWAIATLNGTLAALGLALLLPTIGMSLGAWMLAGPLENILPDDVAAQLRRRRLLYLLLTPMASLLCLWNSIASVLSSKMTWRGVTYCMISDRETVVVSGR